MKHLTVLILLALAVAPGCKTVSEAGGNGYQDLPSKISRGQTTKREVLAIMGEPGRKEASPRGETWIYGGSVESTRGEAVGRQLARTGIGFIPYAGSALGIAGAVAQPSDSTKSGAEITFNERGVVSDYVIRLP